ncbi:RING-H2 finger protein ATL39-like [Dendrobium catenatum]|uniref:RING-H2 finger protein ATL39-like n=1 Tax=Dendrobium catenatum TaxID=906689 RepID=UPI0009F4CDBC|nr:RING-H2 finger protein ATL39-like [Dendrobium catenatum]
MWNYSVVSPPLQPERNADTEIDNATLSTWPTLTYAEAKSRDPRAVNAICCNICFVDYKEDEREDKAMRLLPECGHLFHATCVDPWLWRQHTCPVCRSLVVNRDLQMPLAEVLNALSLDNSSLHHKGGKLCRIEFDMRIKCRVNV